MRCYRVRSRWQHSARGRSNRALLLTALDVVAAGSGRSLAAFIVRALQQNAISLVTLKADLATNGGRERTRQMAICQE